MKNFKKFILVILILPCIFLFNACSFFGSTKVYVTDIKQTSQIGETTTYTVYYSDGSHSVFTVQNGADGDDGDDLTIESIKAYCEANELDFDSFLKQYLTVVQENKSIKDATSIAIQSAVTVWCEVPTSNYYNIKDKELACGAGVIYKMEAEYSYIITNYHVVYNTLSDFSNKIASTIHIFQYGTSEEVYKTNQTDSNGYPLLSYGDGAVYAEYVGGSLTNDIAVLKVSTDDLLTYNENAKPVTIAEDYSLGETAIAIGNPACEGFSVTSGVVSVISEELNMTGADEATSCTFRVMRIDTAINGGNSGGGLFNINGELIGIVNARVVSVEYENMAYALPIDHVSKIADNLIYYYESEQTPSNVKALTLNIGLTSKNSRAVYNSTENETTLQEDVVITSISVGVGNDMDLKIGDIIKSISINGTKYDITQAYQVDDVLLNVREGDKLLITVTRNKITTYCALAEDAGISSSQLIEIA